MGLLGRIEMLNAYRKKQCKTLIYRVRAAMKKATSLTGGGGGSKQHMKFHYDPSSYALNFDDGCQDKDYQQHCSRFIRQDQNHSHLKLQDYLSSSSIHIISRSAGTWVCVLLVN